MLLLLLLTENSAQHACSLAKTHSTSHKLQRLNVTSLVSYYCIPAVPKFLNL